MKMSFENPDFNARAPLPSPRVGMWGGTTEDTLHSNWG